MRSVRAVLKLAPKTVDRDYDARCKEMKEVGAALALYERAAAASKRAVASAVDSMEGMRSAMDKMSAWSSASSTASASAYTSTSTNGSGSTAGITATSSAILMCDALECPDAPSPCLGQDQCQDSPQKQKQKQPQQEEEEEDRGDAVGGWLLSAGCWRPSARDLAVAFAAACVRVKDTHYPQYAEAMGSCALLGVAELKKMHDACRRCAAERNKVCRAFDVCRHEVALTERRYAAKGKDLATSRSYGVDVALCDVLRSRLQSADASFQSAHDRLMHAASETAVKCMAGFIRASAALSGSVAQELLGAAQANNASTTTLATAAGGHTVNSGSRSEGYGCNACHV